MTTTRYVTTIATSFMAGFCLGAYGLWKWFQRR